jgi:hypothetical protein
VIFDLLAERVARVLHHLVARPADVDHVPDGVGLRNSSRYHKLNVRSRDAKVRS